MIYYYRGPRGVYELHLLDQIIATTQHDIAAMEKENRILIDEIAAWKQDLFMQEKFAREQLGMQKPDETIYFRRKHHL